LRLGASTTIGNYLLAGLLADFRDGISEHAHQNWRIQVTIANTEDIAARVTAFELDLGLIEGPCREPELTVLPWREDELVVVVAGTDPIVPKTRSSRVSLKRCELRRGCSANRVPGRARSPIIS